MFCKLSLDVVRQCTLHANIRCKYDLEHICGKVYIVVEVAASLLHLHRIQPIYITLNIRYWLMPGAVGSTTQHRERHISMIIRMPDFSYTMFQTYIRTRVFYRYTQTVLQSTTALFHLKHIRNYCGNASEATGYNTAEATHSSDNEAYNHSDGKPTNGSSLVQ